MISSSLSKRRAGGSMKKKCWRCGTRTKDWEIVNGGLPNCWPCGKIIREEHEKALKAEGEKTKTLVQTRIVRVTI
jgi:hypothetical protein